jgi:hypothetical protein
MSVRANQGCPNPTPQQTMLMSLSVHSNCRSNWTDTTGDNCTNQNHGFQGIYNCGSGSHSFWPLRVISHAIREATSSPTRYPQRPRYEQDTECTGSLKPMRYLRRARCDVDGYLPIPGQGASYGGGRLGIATAVGVSLLAHGNSRVHPNRAIGRSSGWIPRKIRRAQRASRRSTG